MLLPFSVTRNVERAIKITNEETFKSMMITIEDATICFDNRKIANAVLRELILYSAGAMNFTQNLNELTFNGKQMFLFTYDEREKAVRLLERFKEAEGYQWVLTEFFQSGKVVYETDSLESAYRIAQVLNFSKIKIEFDLPFFQLTNEAFANSFHFVKRLPDYLDTGEDFLDISEYKQTFYLEAFQDTFEFTTNQMDKFASLMAFIEGNCEDYHVGMIYIIQ